MPVTKQEQIEQYLRDLIAAGTLAPGAPVPSSRVLAEEMGCARGTATEVLKKLARDGLIVNRAGLGFFVTDTPVARPAGQRSTGTHRTDAALPFRILGRPGVRVPPDHVADALGVERGSEAWCRTRLLSTPGGEPVSVVASWFPREIAEACELLRGTAPIPGGTTRHIFARTGRRPVDGQDVTSPALATPDQLELLGLADPAPVLVVLHSAWDASGVLVVEEGVTGKQHARRVDRYPMNP